MLGIALSLVMARTATSDPNPSNWLLFGGVWRDAGVWVDAEAWED